METTLDTNFDALVEDEAAGDVTPEDAAILHASPLKWAAALRTLLRDIEDKLDSAQRIVGEEREQALTDLRGYHADLAAALRRATGGASSVPETVASPIVGVVALQASWSNDRVVLWAAGPGTVPASPAELDQFIDEAGAGVVKWATHGGVPLPGGGRASAVAAPIGRALGWLVGVGADQLAPDAGASLRWLGTVAAWATELVAQGRMVPTLRRCPPTAGSGSGSSSTARYMVSWVPALVDPSRLADLAHRMPMAVAALDSSAHAESLCRSVLSVAVDTVCREGAGRLVTPATVPVARTRAEVAEAVLAGLDGEAFPAAARPADELGADLKRWASPVTAHSTVRLTVRLDAPESAGGWLLSVHARGVESQPVAVEQAMAAISRTKAHQVEGELRRLERLVPALRRPTSRRGQVMLSGDEAWELMSVTGAVLVAAGFEVRLPAISRRKPTARLHLVADSVTGPSRVGINQLSHVRWSVLFDDVEVTASEIARLAAQARPLVRAGGRWVELAHADLSQAAAALAERAAITELSGAAILRHAVGLEGATLAGPVSVDGNGWAVDLVRNATSNPPEPRPAPPGFVGELRHYQAEAAGWLTFLDGAGLGGGCLAMDMGLGKTPVVLAHILATRGNGPALVIAPPAVLGNWSAEAARFTPDLRVHIHHGTDRANADAIGGVTAKADIVLTTYATAVRDVDILAQVDWRRLIIDEAQAIKNPASETAQQLRRISSPSRLALTGTPVENGLGDLWAILDFTNPGLVGPRVPFIEQLSRTGGGQRAAGEAALRALNGLLVFRRTKTEPEIAAELPDKIDTLDHCTMTPEQAGLYQAVIDRLLADEVGDDSPARKGRVLAAITALKQICDHPAAYLDNDQLPLDGRSGKLTRLDEIVGAVFEAGERVLVFTHFARWGERLAEHLTKQTGVSVACYHGGLSRIVRDRLVREFQEGTGPGALVLSLKAGGTGLNLTAASHVVLYDRWWNPAVEDQARDRAWRIGQKNTVVSHRLVCPGTVDERVEEVVAGKRRIADLVLPASSSLGDLSADQLRAALGIRPDALIEDEPSVSGVTDQETAA
jgi:hypothetical protein